MKLLQILLCLLLVPAKLFAATADQNVGRFVKAVTARKLRNSSRVAATHSQKALVQKTIMKESARTKIDPILIVAVIERESQFHVHKRGTHGEIGLMQIKPRTAKWIARRRGIQWHGKKQLDDPAMNIRIGTAYLAMLRDQFQTPDLYLAAYNGGPTHLRRVMREGLLPRSYYANSVLVNYHAYSDSFRPRLRTSYRPL